MSKRLVWVAAVLLTVLSGCPKDEGDDGSGSHSGGGSSVHENDACVAHVGWVERCQDEPDFSYTTDWGQDECPMLAWRYIEPAYIEGEVECFETLPCTEYDDACTVAGFSALGLEDESDVADDELFHRCLELADSCEELIDDSCLTLVAFTPAGRSAVEHCLDLACDQIKDCLHDPD